MSLLQGKTVVITGGGRGIGRGIANEMSRHGANVVVAGRSTELLQAAAAEIAADGGHARAITADITNPADIDRLVAGSIEAFGYIDCWVNNAGGVSPGDSAPLFKLDEGMWDRVIDLNLKWACFSAVAAAKSMMRGGSIINISSIAATAPSPSAAWYGAAKAAIESLTTSMATEWGKFGIRVNAISPGLVITAEGPASPGAAQRATETVGITPLQRNGVPEDIGGACVFLASELSSWLTGQIIPVNGGSVVPTYYLPYLTHTNRAVMERLRDGLAQLFALKR